MNFSVLPPEINSAQMFSGAGSGPMLAAAAGWDGLASELGSAAASFSSVTSGLAAQAWQGTASQAMVAAAAPYTGWLSVAATQASGAAAQAKAVASAFESALAATVHPLTVAANRNGLVQLVMSNLFGQNAPAIAATEANYEEMWAQDVTAMVGYHGGASAAAAQLTGTAQALQNLPGLAANAAADAFGNTGTGNIGFGNSGSNNIGFFNSGSGNVGAANTGNNNIGFHNSGDGNNGIDNINPIILGNKAHMNSQLGDNGFFNRGFFNDGGFNTGDGNQGYFNTGNDNLGIGLTGNNLQGIGIPGVGQIAVPK
jgi:PPE-repeat protein